MSTLALCYLFGQQYKTYPYHVSCQIEKMNSRISNLMLKLFPVLVSKSTLLNAVGIVKWCNTIIVSSHWVTVLFTGCLIIGIGHHTCS